MFGSAFRWFGFRFASKSIVIVFVIGVIASESRFPAAKSCFDVTITDKWSIIAGFPSVTIEARGWNSSPSFNSKLSLVLKLTSPSPKTVGLW